MGMLPVGAVFQNFPECVVFCLPIWLLARVCSNVIVVMARGGKAFPAQVTRIRLLT